MSSVFYPSPSILLPKPHLEKCSIGVNQGWKTNKPKRKSPWHTKKHSDELWSDLQLPHIISIFNPSYFRLASKHSTCSSRASLLRRSEHSDFCTSAIASQALPCTCWAQWPTHMTRGDRLRYSNDARCPGNLRGEKWRKGELNGKHITFLLTKASGENKEKTLPCLLMPLHWNSVDSLSTKLFFLTFHNSHHCLDFLKKLKCKPASMPPHARTIYPPHTLPYTCWQTFAKASLASNSIPNAIFAFQNPYVISCWKDFSFLYLLSLNPLEALLKNAFMDRK